MGQGRGGLDPATSGALRNPSGVLGGTGYRTKDWIERLRGSHRRGGQMLGKQRLVAGRAKIEGQQGIRGVEVCWLLGPRGIKFGAPPSWIAVQ